MSQKDLMGSVKVIVDELTNLSPEDRGKVVGAALAFLGEEPIKFPGGSAEGEGLSSAGEVQVPARARSWMKQNSLSMDQLQEVFHFEDEAVEVIASEIPGNKNRERVRNAYMLTGISQLLSNGEPKFSDKAARELCERSGFYDSTNHAKYVKGGNEFTGSREKGWTLTSPGLRVGANTIKEMTNE